MKFQFIDHVLEQSENRIVAVKQVSLAEEYLADHFPRFPVLPGVLMLETMVEAGRILLRERAGDSGPLVLSKVKALKFGNFVRPGDALVVDVALSKDNGDGTYDCKGSGKVSRQDQEPATAVSGRFVLRPIRVE